MATVEPATEELFVGLENAVTDLPERWTRAENALVIAFLLLVQLAWLAAFAYAAYRFIR